MYSMRFDGVASIRRCIRFDDFGSIRFDVFALIRRIRVKFGTPGRPFWASRGPPGGPFWASRGRSWGSFSARLGLERLRGGPKPPREFPGQGVGPGFSLCKIPEGWSEGPRRIDFETSLETFVKSELQGSRMRVLEG